MIKIHNSVRVLRAHPELCIGDGLIHERVLLDEVELRFGQGGGIIDALAGTISCQAVDVLDAYRKPVRISCRLTLEGALVERVPNVRQAEAANGTSGDGVFRCREHAVNDFVRLADVDEVRSALDLVEVERHLAGNGAVESGLQKGRPAILKLVRTTAVVFADSGNTGVDALKNLFNLVMFSSRKRHRSFNIVLSSLLLHF